MATFFGVGRSFRKGKDGIPARVEDVDLVRDSIFQTINTVVGERVMRPTFGSLVTRLLFETTGPVLTSLAKREIQRSLRQFEPRVKILEVITTERDTVLNIDVTYSVLGVESTVSVSVA